MLAFSLIFSLDVYDMLWWPVSPLRRQCAGGTRARAHNPPPGGTIRIVFGPESSNAIRAAHIESKRDMCNSKYNTIFTVITTDI